MDACTHKVEVRDFPPDEPLDTRVFRMRRPEIDSEIRFEGCKASLGWGFVWRGLTIRRLAS